MRGVNLGDLDGLFCTSLQNMGFDVALVKAWVCWRRGHKGWGWAGLHQGPALTPHPEPCFSSSLSHNSISLESALGLVKTLPSCPHIREASVK